MIIGRPELVKQIKSGIDHVLGTRTGLVDLVHYQNRFQTECKRFFGHKAGLRHRAFLRIDQQDHAVDH